MISVRSTMCADLAVSILRSEDMGTIRSEDVSTIRDGVGDAGSGDPRGGVFSKGSRRRDFGAGGDCFGGEGPF